MLQKLLLIILLIGSVAAQAQTLSPHIFDAVPWQDRISAKGMASNLRYQQFLLLMPRQFRLLSSRNVPEIQQWLDNSVTRILNTPIGSLICQVSTNGRVEHIQTSFGVSQATAQNLIQVCTPTKPHRISKRTEKTREFIFVQTTDLDPSAEGWTTSENVTYIFLTEKDFTEHFLFRILAHEMLIQLDIKGQWGMTNELDTFSKWLNVRYQGSRSKDVLKSIRHPLILHGLSTLRALWMENRILAELGLEKELDPPPPESCIGDLRAILPAIERIGPIIHLKNTDAWRAENSSLSIAKALQILAEEKVIDLDFNREWPLCDYLRIPKLAGGGFNYNIGGPRPRVGPWDKESKDARDRLETKSQSLSENKLDFKEYSSENSPRLINRSEDNQKDLTSGRQRPLPMLD